MLLFVCLLKALVVFNGSDGTEPTYLCFAMPFEGGLLQDASPLCFCSLLCWSSKIMGDKRDRRDTIITITIRIKRHLQATLWMVEVVSPPRQSFS